MMRRTKTLGAVLALTLFVTGCASGNTANNNGNVSGQGGMAQGITGKGAYEGNVRTRSANDGRVLPQDGVRSPFPQQSVRPLNQTGNNGAGAGTQMRMQQQQAGQQHQGAVIPFVSQPDGQYIPAEELVRLLEFKNWEYDPATGEMTIGDNDVALKIRAGSRDAEIAEIPFKLAAPPKLINGQMMIPKSAVADLFAEEMVFDVTPQGLVVYPSDTSVVGRDTDDMQQDEPTDPSLDFADDPTDPFAGGDDGSEGVFLPEDESIPALKNININGLIRTSKRYLGVKYKFGAKPYPQSHRFDCSSFTQYVYGKYGIKLPRTARAQARIGQTVSRKNLRKGDLLYFYVPGRFKSNKIIGHVGIYIGNGNMINANTEPKNGVQIRNINRAFYKKTFIKAKRVAY
jgi:hypothetical protein